MKYFALVLSLLAAYQISAQRHSGEKYKLDVIEYPTLSTSDLRSISFKIDNSYSTVNQDELRGYTGTMVMLNGGISLKLRKFQGRSINQLELINGLADMNVEISMGQPEILDMEVRQTERAQALGGVAAYYYAINHKYPMVVKITDRYGDLIDIWKPSEQNYVDFGYSKTVKRTDTFLGEEFTVNFNIYTSESELDVAYLLEGRYYVERDAFLLQLKKAIEAVDEKIYFWENQHKFDIFSGKGGKHNYGELDIVRSQAISAIESRNFEELVSSIEIWEQYLSQADDESGKAKVNSWVKAGLLSNLAVAHMYLENYDKAIGYADAHADQVDYAVNKPRKIGNAYVEVTNTSWDKELSEARYLRSLIRARAKSFKNKTENYDFEHLHTGIDLKKELGRKDKNHKFNLFDNQGKYDSFYNQYLNYETTKAAKEAVTTDVGVEIKKVNPYEKRLLNILGSEYKILELDFLNEDENLAGGEFPAEIAGLTQLGMLNATYMDFSELPEDFGRLENLTNITMYRNNFSKLPESIGEISNLKFMDFSYNKLESLPNSIGNLKNLENMRLVDNNLKSLPSSIGDCTALKDLNLKNNQLTSLPDSLKNCRNLKRLNLQGNKFSSAEKAKIQSWFTKVKIKL